MKNNEAIRIFVERAYDIGRVEGISPLSGGYSRVFRVDAEAGSFVLKETASGGMNTPENEPAIHHQLKKHGIPVSTFIENKNRSYLCVEDGFVYHLQTLEKGYPLKRNTASPLILEESARMLGRLHRIMVRHLPLPEGMDPAWCSRIQSGSAASHHTASLPWADHKEDAEAGQLIRWKVAHVCDLDTIGIDFKHLTRGNTHGDYHVYQLLVSGSRISAVLDFTGASRLPLCWEVIRSYCYADPACMDGGINIHNLVSYVSIYLSEFKLARYDLEKMADFYYFQLLACNYFSQMEHAHPDNAAHIADITVWATKVCVTLSDLRRDICQELVRLA